MNAKVEMTEAQLIADGATDELLDAVLVSYVVKEGLPRGLDAEELLKSSVVTARQQTWLENYIRLWESTVDDLDDDSDVFG